MKKLGDLMKELGFNPESSQGAQEAFIKNLIREAYGVEVQTPTEKRFQAPLKKSVRKSNEPSQMSFDLRDLVPADDSYHQKRKRTGTR